MAGISYRVPAGVLRGEFTPTFADDDFDGTGKGQVYGVQLGRYQLVDGWVHFFLSVGIDDLGTLDPAEVVRLLGMPFTAKNVVDTHHVFSVSGSSFDLPAATATVMARILYNTDYIFLGVNDQATGPSALLVSELSAFSNLIVSGAYEIES